MADYQRQGSSIILEAVAQGGNIEIPFAWARRVGKTDMTSMTAMTVGVYYVKALQEDIDIGFINPAKTEQGIMVTRDRLRRRCLDVKGYLQVGLEVETVLDLGRKTADFVFVGPEGYEARIRCISADAHANEKGAGFQLSFFEQVEDMDEDVMKSILFPMAAGQVLQSCRVLAGTPSLEVKNNYFYDITRNLRYPQFVDDKFAEHWRPDYGEWVRKERERLGAESEVYKTQYRCIWIIARNRLADKDKMISLGQLDYQPEAGRDRFAGTDVAKDIDSTVCTILEMEGADEHILAWYEAEGTDYETQYDELKAFLQDWGVVSNMVDATGVGDPVVDSLSKRCRGVCHTIPFEFTSDSHDTLWKTYEPELRHDRLHYPKNIEDEIQQRCRNRFIEQHCKAERRVIGNKIKVEKPARKGSHIDYVISSALAVYCAIHGKASEPDAVGGG
jgi:hypothetical protein